jgi:methanogenic corrinoid protein MtbC1
MVGLGWMHRMDSSLDTSTRFALAERVRALSAAVAAEVTERFLSVHPDWLARYGERARLMGIEDAQYHVTFLAAALESGTAAAFADYARWTSRVLESRGMARSFLAENLEQVRDSLASRVTDATAAIEELVSNALAALRETAATEAADPSRDRLALTREMYLQAILAGERVAALTVATEALRDGATALDVYVDVLQAALYEVGRRWEANRITVAHEHAATAITQFVIANLYPRLDRSAAGQRGTMLITGLPGELHSVGAMMVADVLETRGWNVHFLGTNLPHRAIVDAIRERHPECVGISATMLFSLTAVRMLISSVRDEWGLSKRIVVGGAAFRQSREVWRELGADGHARDLREALALLGGGDR